MYVFVGMTFHTKTQIKHTLTVRYCNRYSTTTTPKYTMSSPVVTKIEGMKMTKQTTIFVLVCLVISIPSFLVTTSELMVDLVVVVVE